MVFIYAFVALGVYITYKILDFPGLSVDGTFPLGGVVFSVLLTAGCPWAVAMVASFAAGCAAGLAASAGCSVRDVDVDRLHELLARNNARF